MPETDTAPELPQDVLHVRLETDEVEALQNRLAELEDAIARDSLSQEWQTRQLIIDEIRQRIRMRTIAVSVVVVIILFMAGILAHAVHKFFWWRLVVVPYSLAIAMFLGPIVSITTLAVVMVVGAFRRFKDEDLGKVSLASLTAEATRTSMS